MKNENHNPLDSLERQHYKKRYLLRKLEEAEADKLIKTYNEQRETESTLDSQGQEPEPL
jgi:hypothetical protein